MPSLHFAATARAALFCALTALAPLSAFAEDAVPAESEYGTNRAPVQVFYVPLPEEHVHDALRSIWGDYKPGTSRFGAPESPMESYVYLAIFLDNTVIYYDQWEDGYERDIANPNHPWSVAEPFGTQIWGDGDVSNGCAPGIPADRLFSGDIIELHSTVREPFAGLVEILDADGNVTAETDGLAVPADPSGVLSVRIPTTEADVSGFFSLRVNILNDGSDIR